MAQFDSIRFEPAVRAALDAGKGVVALESTLVAHGLPWPDNLDVAAALEQEIRDQGATPATIAVLDGVPCIGLAAAELERVARAGQAIAKAGSADLAVAIARGGSAATTVSATCVLAARAGIRVFATGGMGGVHRGYNGDVSSDLGVLAGLPMVVVSAGSKAILDLPRTLETLETLGVLVLGYRTNDFPAFYTRSSGLPLEHRVDTPDEAARILQVRWALGLGGVLVANPIPEEDALDAKMIEAAIVKALALARSEGVHGKALTPFLLGRLAQVTSGASIQANRALAKHNARVAATIAFALARLG